MMSTGKDVVSFLKGQHQQVKGLLEGVLAATGKEREKAFFTLRRMLAVHETAEEEIVHPAARKNLPDGEAIVRARLHEEHEAKQALVALESLDVDSPEFETKFRKLKAAVLAHAESEETEEFEQLGQTLEPARLERMRKAAEFAESVAPTRPHAGVESAAANMLAGPFVAMVDRTRDALSSSKS
ncbi:MAG TPA: hemerythrin domain-containing protein [Polyangiaceae bacterium]|nr:hemerythrin domain-containing protein [Polyangiaceae bacterium]